MCHKLPCYTYNPNQGRKIWVLKKCWFTDIIMTLPCRICLNLKVVIPGVSVAYTEVIYSLAKSQGSIDRAVMKTIHTP